MGLLDRFGSPRRRFAAQALRVARRTPGVARAVAEPGAFAIAVYRTGSESPARLYLDNIFAECAGASRAECAERLARLVRVMVTPPADDDWTTVRAKLRPVLRPVTFGLAGPVGVRPPLSRPALPHLKELVVVDLPDSMAYVLPDRLDGWGVTADEVFETARANLAEIARRTLERPWPGEPMLITMVDDGNGYFTSLLLAPGWLAGVAERMGTPVLAFVPDHHHLLLCPLPQEEAGPLYRMVEEHFTEAVRSLSPVGYTVGGDGRPVPYAPPPGHPHRSAARRAAAMLAVIEYSGQTDWLTRQYRENGVDVHVGSLLAVEPDDGGPAQTVASWIAGVESLLPVADAIAFVHPEHGVAFRAPWPAVAELVGLRPEPLLAPARVRVTDWPPPAILAELRRHSLD